LPLAALVGDAVVHETVARAVDAAVVDEVEAGTERVLFKTPNSELWELDAFVEDNVSLTEEGARALVERGVRLVGIDYLSIGGEQAHEVLLRAGVVAIESLDLRGVEPGRYTLVCAPLKLVGSDGAPARVLLLR
jgi:arylformamidase